MKAFTTEELQLLKSILLKPHFLDDIEFKTDEIRIEEKVISIWNVVAGNWLYLNNNLEWQDSDNDDENIYELKSE